MTKYVIRKQDCDDDFIDWIGYLLISNANGKQMIFSPAISDVGYV